MTLTCTRRIEFDAAHRVMEHESKCKLLHGHRYVIEATFAADELDALGRVIDFGSVRQILGEWVDSNWDHNMILHQDDKTLGEEVAKLTGQDVFYLPFNPTAERMAEYLLQDVCPKIFAKDGAKCTKIRLYETPNCYAEAML